MTPGCITSRTRLLSSDGTGAGRSASVTRIGSYVFMPFHLLKVLNALPFMLPGRDRTAIGRFPDRRSAYYGFRHHPVDR